MHGPSTALLDFNRVGQPLIEIITHPNIHSAQEAVACVRKTQAILQAVNAVTTGMELGGLRADVNVSVAPTGSDLLGQRVEIKNLGTLQSIEAAITAEQNRQISVLGSGGAILGETRGWSLGNTKTTRLRGKEGEVDYRYMPDPDIPPLLIGEVCISTHPHPFIQEPTSVGSHIPHGEYVTTTTKRNYPRSCYHLWLDPQRRQNPCHLRRRRTPRLFRQGQRSVESATWYFISSKSIANRGITQLLGRSLNPGCLYLRQNSSKLVCLAYVYT